MFSSPSRRTFLKASAASGLAAGLGDLGFLKHLPIARAEETQVKPAIVALASDIEPLVKLLEETPRGALLEAVASKIRKGTSYQEVLAALQLAGVRNVQPRPQVGFKFHSVLVVNSAHLASMASPDEHRWLPIFWALDYFKSAQARDVDEGDWTMAPVEEAAVPAASKSRQALEDALANWSEPAADAAAAGMARSASVGETYELFYRYGARDFRSIGHKAIYVANSRRTLECIGWRHAEPILRSLAYALLMHEGDNPSTRDAEPDRAGRRNEGLAKSFRADWLNGSLDDGAALDFLAVLRQASADEACDAAAAAIDRGVSPQSIWDAMFLASGELLMRQPGIVALHASTTSNAIRYAYDNVVSDETRRWLLLQNAAFLTHFREAMRERGDVAELRIDELTPAESKAGADELVGETFASVGRDSGAAARTALAFLESGAPAQTLIDAARVTTFLKGNDSHDYKFTSAAFEDYLNVSPSLRNRFLAASVYKWRGSGEADNDLVSRTRAALA
jgi:hypothetical protein